VDERAEAGKTTGGDSQARFNIGPHGDIYSSPCKVSVNVVDGVALFETYKGSRALQIL